MSESAIKMTSQINNASPIAAANGPPVGIICGSATANEVCFIASRPISRRHHHCRRFFCGRRYLGIVAVVIVVVASINAIMLVSDSLTPVIEQPIWHYEVAL